MLQHMLNTVGTRLDWIDLIEMIECDRFFHKLSQLAMNYFKNAYFYTKELIAL